MTTTNPYADLTRVRRPHDDAYALRGIDLRDIVAFAKCPLAVAPDEPKRRPLRTAAEFRAAHARFKLAMLA